MRAAGQGFREGSWGPAATAVWAWPALVCAAREQQALSSVQGWALVCLFPVGLTCRGHERFRDERQRDELPARSGLRPGRRGRRTAACSRKPYRHGCNPAPRHARVRARSAAPGLLPWWLPTCWGSWPACWNSAAHLSLSLCHRRAARAVLCLASSCLGRAA